MRKVEIQKKAGIYRVAMRFKIVQFVQYSNLTYFEAVSRCFCLEGKGFSATMVESI